MAAWGGLRVACCVRLEEQPLPQSSGCLGLRCGWGDSLRDPCFVQTEFLIYNPPFYSAERKDEDLVDPVGK